MTAMLPSPRMSMVPAMVAMAVLALASDVGGLRVGICKDKGG